MKTRRSDSTRRHSPEFLTAGGLVYSVLALVVVSLPALVGVGLVVFYLEQDPLGYTPQWSDEVFNWHQVATFRVAGFGGQGAGYIVIGFFQPLGAVS